MNLLDRAKQVLWEKSGLPHDLKGYVEDVHQNLISGLTPDMIKEDFRNGGGQEWRKKIRKVGRWF